MALAPCAARVSRMPAFSASPEVVFQAAAVDRGVDDRPSRAGREVLLQLVGEGLGPGAFRGQADRIHAHAAEHAAGDDGRGNVPDALARPQVLEHLAEVAVVVDEAHGGLGGDGGDAGLHGAGGGHGGGGRQAHGASQASAGCCCSGRGGRSACRSDDGRARPCRDCSHHQAHDDCARRAQAALVVFPVLVGFLHLLPGGAAGELGVVAQLLDPGHAGLPGQGDEVVAGIAGRDLGRDRPVGRHAQVCDVEPVVVRALVLAARVVGALEHHVAAAGAQAGVAVGGAGGEVQATVGVDVQVSCVHLDSREGHVAAAGDAHFIAGSEGGARKGAFFAAHIRAAAVQAVAAVVSGPGLLLVLAGVEDEVALGPEAQGVACA